MLAKWHEPSPGLGYIDLGVGEAQTSFTCTNGISRFAIFRHQAGNIGTMTASLNWGRVPRVPNAVPSTSLMLACLSTLTLFVILTLWHFLESWADLVLLQYPGNFTCDYETKYERMKDMLCILSFIHPRGKKIVSPHFFEPTAHTSVPTRTSMVRKITQGCDAQLCTFNRLASLD